MLKYNIDFEIMGLVITLVIAFYFHMNYVVTTRSDKAFKKLLYFILIAIILDILTAFSFSLENPKWNMFNLLSNNYNNSFLSRKIWNISNDSISNNVRINTRFLIT